MRCNDAEISVEISANPRVLAANRKARKLKLSKFDPGLEYVARNHDIFEKHYFDTDFSFDDEDLFDELRRRGEYK